MSFTAKTNSRAKNILLETAKLNSHKIYEISWLRPTKVNILLKYIFYYIARFVTFQKISQSVELTQAAYTCSKLMSA